MDQYMEIGKIVNTHGIKGELKIIPSTDDIKRFELLDSVLVEERGDLVEYLVLGVRYMKQFVLLKLEGVNDMTEAEKLKTFTLKIPREQALPLEENQFYVRDLYEMQVITDEGEELGEIADVLFTGGNDVYVIRNKEKPEVKDLLIPAIMQCVLSVDLEKNLMTVHLMAGLRD